MVRQAYDVQGVCTMAAKWARARRLGCLGCLEGVFRCPLLHPYPSAACTLHLKLFSNFLQCCLARCQDKPYNCQAPELRGRFDFGLRIKPWSFQQIMDKLRGPRLNRKLAEAPRGTEVQATHHPQPYALCLPLASETASLGCW